ncbi:unnamed protein product [Clonostachys chloroleuca]|uniref:Vegetative incompatibility protein HET-E-1 n=1 Tax=Clonostachys chloroleuca TaxID=1926264 RepID=A0AA35QA41_9HYPO|nr:unnamed protein product [Clonostachys chloroleuca]
MSSRDVYTVGWVCALPVEATAAKAALDCVHDTIPQDRNPNDNNNYIFGRLHGHHIVVAYPSSGVYGQVSLADVVRQLHASYTSIRFHLIVGIAGGVPDTGLDIRLGDVVVNKSINAWSGVIQYDEDGERIEDNCLGAKALDQPSPMLLTAMGKAETAAIFNESKMSRYISEIMQKDPITFVYPDPEQDLLFESDYDHATYEQSGCRLCDPTRLRSRQTRQAQGPITHYGLIASCNHLMLQGAKRDRLSQAHGILCFETEANGARHTPQYLVIRGICDYADSHRSQLWHAYAAVTAAAYAKEVLSFVPTVYKTKPLVTNSYTEAVPILDALLLTRPEVDRKSLIALKGRRVDGTFLWISGGPGKGKTMLAIYITEMLQPLVDKANNTLLYYFCSNRDKNRNTALTIMRGILHQWIDIYPHLAKYIKNSFEGTNTTKYTISSFMSLWRVFLALLPQSTSSEVICVLDGLDECEKESLRQLLDAIGNHFSKAGEQSRTRLKLIILSRPQPAILENKLSHFKQIQLDSPDTQISYDVEKYIFAKVAELASEQNLSDEMVAQVQHMLLAGADGTFLWVAFVANELQGRSWSRIDEVLRQVPKGLGGIYQRLLQQVGDKTALLPILQWVVLAARPLTLEELTVAAGIKAVGTLSAIQVTTNLLRLGGLLVKVEGDVVNLVHESAKEFFHSEQVNIKEIDMFRMSSDTHRSLMQTCLLHIECGYGSPGSVRRTSGHDSFLSYASQYWPIHFQHAIPVIDASPEFSRPFFRVDSPIRDEWWKSYWEQEKNGGSPPSFTLLHLAAYFGNVPWAKILISEHPRLISRKDNYGRTPLSWAVNQGHRHMVELLLGHGARVNFKDRSMLTALHIAINGQHRDVVSILLKQGAYLEAKGEHGDTDTPLMRAILANSREIIQDLLEHGARVDRLPGLLGVASLRGPSDPMEERVKELLELQDQVFVARFKRSSRFVDMVMKGLGLSLHIPLALEVMSLYLKFMTLNRWDSLSVLQELVQENRRNELREWARMYHVFFLGIINARNPKKLKAMGDLSTQILQRVAPKDLQALLAITVFTGMETKLAAVEHGWREGAAITAAAISNWATIASDRDALEFFHFGIREFLSDFDACVQTPNKRENVLRTTVLITTHFALVNKQKPEPVEYFSRVVTELFQGYIDSTYEVKLFSDANQACANELTLISESNDSAKLQLFLTSIFQFARQANEKGQDRFLDLPSAACFILCQRDATAHQWLIGEAILEELGSLIAKESTASLQKRACKTLVECLIIAKQYGLTSSTSAPRKRVEEHLQSLPGVRPVMSRILG